MSSSQRLQFCVKLCTGTGITKKLLLSWLFSLSLDVAKHCCCVRPGLCTTFLVITSPERIKDSLEEIPTSPGTSSARTVLAWTYSKHAVGCSLKVSPFRTGCVYKASSMQC